MRILITRLFALGVFAVLLFSNSRWETEAPAVSAALFFCAMILVGIASLGRLWCSLYIAGRKDRLLVRQGPYSLSRNPLYFFSFIGAVGAGLATETLIVPAFLAIAFLVYYPIVISAEEKKLAQIFPEEFPGYLASVPRFFPKSWKAVEPSSYEVDPRIFRRHLFSALWFIWAVGFIEVLEELHELGLIPVHWSLY